MCDSHETVTKKPETYWLPKTREDQLKREIAKFNKKATKLDCPPITYKILNQKEVVVKKYAKMIEIYGAADLPHETLIEVEIVGEGPKIEGWKFLGTLDHYSLPGAVIINTVPGEKIPDQFHNDDASCDHCGKVRRRNETFVLQEDDTGDYKRVGRQCVRDFIGYDPRSVMNFMRALDRLMDDFIDEEKWGSSGPRFYTFEHDSILKKTAAMIDKYGWVPRSAADEDHQPTANLVLEVFFPPKYDTKAYAEWKKWKASLNLDDPRWEKDAQDARLWLQQQKSEGEYWHNLHAIDEADEVPTHLFGYWCSVMSGYYRAQEKLRLAAREKKLNEHVGEVKQRLNFIVTLKKRRSFDGAYGTVRLHEFRDDEGRTLTWWANVDPEMDLDGKYKIKGTVKKHDDYNGWAQTVLTRVKVVEEIEQEEAA